jgi:hypothetical protein
MVSYKQSNQRFVKKYYFLALALIFIVPGAIVSAATATFQYGVNGYTGSFDNELSDSEPDTTYASGGSNYSNAVGTRFCGSYCNNALFRFTDLGLDSNVTITNVTLELKVRGNQGNAGNILAHKVTRSNWDPAAVTWNRYNSSLWSTAGGDRGAELDRVTAAGSGQWVTLDFDDDISLAELATNGILVSNDIPGWNYVWFYANEAGSATDRPKLTITYDGEGGGGNPGDTTAPSAPTGLSATAGSATQVSLTWNAATDNVGVTGYRVYRGNTLIATLGTVTAYTDTGRSANTTYTYTVRALDAVGNVSSDSNTASVTTPSGTTPNPAPTVTISANPTSVSSGSTASVSWSSANATACTVTGGGTSRTGISGTFTTAALTAATTYTASCTGAGGSVSGNVTVAVSTVTPPPTGGTILGVTIPGAHPRLWWNAERLADARAWYQTNAFTPGASDPLGQALRCVLTGESSYCQNAVNYAMGQMCTNAACTSNNPNVGVASDDARWYGEIIALIFDWCYDYFTPAQRATLIDRWNTYFANIRIHSWGGPEMYQSNYNWGYMRNEILWGLATWGENTQAETNLRYALEDRWREHFVPHAEDVPGGRGGVFHEGSNYGLSIADYSIVPAISLDLMGRDMYRETDFFREAMYYIIYSTTPLPTWQPGLSSPTYEVFPFADDERFWEGGYMTRVGYPGFASTIANHYDGTHTEGYAREWLGKMNASVPRHIRAVDEGGSRRSFTNLPLDYYAPGTQYFYGKTSWSSPSTAWVWQMGRTMDEGHRHNDVGSWQLWRNGRWLSRETTGYSATVVGYNNTAGVDTNHAVAHNTLLVNGRGPVAYEERGPSVTRRLETRDEYAYAAVDLTPVYQSDHYYYANPEAVRVEREFLFVKPLDTMLIFDRAQSNSASASKTFLAHFLSNPTIDQANRTVTANSGDQTLRMTTLVPSSPTYRVVTEGGAHGQYRLELETSGAAQSYFLNVLQARDGSESNLTATVSETQVAYTVTLTHPSRGTATVTFNKGAATNGGSVTVDGQTYTLTNSVQSIIVNDNGPVWGNVSGGTPAPTSTIPVDTTAPVLSSIAAGGITTQGATISWSTNEASDTRVEYGTTAAYGSVTAGAANTTAHTLTLSNLAAATTYHYRVRSTDVAGNEAISTSRTFTTAAPAVVDTTAPSTITNLVAASPTHTSAQLTWSAPGNNGVSGTATSYELRYSTTPLSAAAFGSGVQATGVPAPLVSGTAQSYALVGLTPNTTYSVALRARDAAGNVGGVSNIVTFTTAVAPSTGGSSGGGGGGGLSSHGNVAITRFTGTALEKQVALTWVNPSDRTFVRALLVRGTTRVPTSPTNGTVLYEGSGTSFTDTNLTNGKKYYYAIFPVTTTGVATRSSATLTIAPKSGVRQITGTAPVAAAVSTSQASVTELLALIAQLQAQLNVLLAQRGQGTSNHTFTRDLQIGMEGEDVRALQKLLNQRGYTISTTGSGAPGSESTFFGNRLQEALKKYQRAQGIDATGYFGPLTRGKINGTAQ